MGQTFRLGQPEVIDLMVELTGIEPVASSLRIREADVTGDSSKKQN
jgi:hypothetical protein